MFYKPLQSASVFVLSSVLATMGSTQSNVIQVEDEEFEPPVIIAKYTIMGSNCGESKRKIIKGVLKQVSGLIDDMHRQASHALSIGRRDQGLMWAFGAHASADSIYKCTTKLRNARRITIDSCSGATRAKPASSSFEPSSGKLRVGTAFFDNVRYPKRSDNQAVPTAIGHIVHEMSHRFCDTGDTFVDLDGSVHENFYFQDGAVADMYIAYRDSPHGDPEMLTDLGDAWRIFVEDVAQSGACPDCMEVDFD